MNIRSWFRSWWSWRAREDDLDRELRVHLELATEEQQEQGLSPHDARHAARREFGSVTYVKEEMRVMWGWM